MTAAFDIFAVPLTGTQLIEASAGTGKTHTIGNLFVRLLAETGRTVDTILILTFTNAATAELRTRIRQRLREVGVALRTGSVPDDPFIAGLMQRLGDPAAARLRIEAAIAGFDQAAIYTIHGFCQRLLGDHAFASGTPFAAEILPDESGLLAEIAQDLWRREIYAASPLFVECLLARGISTPDDLLRPVRVHVGKPSLRVLGGESDSDCADIETAFLAAFDAAGTAWRAGRAEVSALLLGSPALNGNSYKVGSVETWLAALERMFSADSAATMALPKWMDRCTPATLREKTNKNKQTPEHPFFARCETLLQRAADLSKCHAARRLHLRRRLLEYCEAELKRRKQRTRQQSYDDLLNQLAAALQDTRAETLIAAVRRQYGAVLIDEFQDTDPVQYAIFSRLYRDSDLPLFLVGDPKQAIYGFRGADVYAYLAARKDAQRTHPLTHNWRSEPGLIAAVNAVFAAAPRPFLLDSIGFTRVAAAPAERRELRFGTRREPPFVLWFLRRDNDDGLMNKEEAGRRVARATAGEIARLLAPGAKHAPCLVDSRGGTARLSGGDIAVLVRTHRQGQAIKQALAVHGIHSVEQADDSVFDSEEALELMQLLRAVAAPGEDVLVRTALSTTLLGVDGSQLQRLGENEAEWEKWLLCFNDYHELWREAGFFAMFRRLLKQQDVPRRLLALRDGERRMTNLLHLAELLQAEAAHGRHGMTDLVDWLLRQHQDVDTKNEAQQLRLESDEQLVQIVTVHRSKGLEYPVVFCPFAWDERTKEDKAKPPIFFHDPAHADAATLQLDGTDKMARAQAGLEARAESLRLYYVALTRAKNRCYVMWGAINGAERSAPAWLLHRRRRRFGSDDGFMAWFKDASDAQLMADLHALATAAPGAIGIDVLPQAAAGDIASVRPQAMPLAARRFSGRIAAPWRIQSYSGLVRAQMDDRPDHDAHADVHVPDTAEPAADIFGFPRGARAGSCLHAILERVDFSARDMAAWSATVARELERHGYAPRWTETLVRMLGDVTGTALDGEGLRLAYVGPGRRLNELEFHYPLRRFARRDLQKLLAAHEVRGFERRQIDRLQFDPEAGYMKGYIDMVFEAGGRWYIADYKSNWLGARAEDYAAERLAAVMAEECYGLQYLIYTLALHRYLRWRLSGYDYARHFGGVYYLFVRGMSPARGQACGVYADRPPPALIAELDRYIAGESA